LNVIGGAAFYEDEDKESHFIRVINLDTGAAVWEQEMYHDLKYYSPTQFFSHSW